MVLEGLQLEFRVTFFMILDFLKLEFYVKLEFTKLEFQKMVHY